MLKFSSPFSISTKILKKFLSKKSFEKSSEHLSKKVWTKAPRHDHQVAIWGLWAEEGNQRA
jgi:hypothetical protein